jgi:hypothetical protein
MRLNLSSRRGSNRGEPSAHPETVNHERPPAWHLADLFRSGAKKQACSKTRDAAAILRDKDLDVSAARRPELRAFLDTILALASSWRRNSAPAAEASTLSSPPE